MTIEFRCTSCNKLLRVPEGTGGKTAKCPQCGNLLAIPEQTQASAVVEDEPALAPPPPPLRPPSDNPFQSPAAHEMRAEHPPGEIRRGFTPTRIDLGDVMGRSWQIYKANFWPCVGATLLFLLVSNAVTYGVAFATRDVQGLAAIPIGLLNYAASIFFSLGALTYMLKVARGDDANVGDLFGGGPLLLPAIGVAILYTLSIMAGFLLLIVGAFYVMILFSPALLVLIDQRTGVIDTMRLASHATKGNKLTIFALFCVSFGLFVLGILAFIVGVLFVYPYLFLTFTVAYLRMTGQSTAAD